MQAFTRESIANKVVDPRVRRSQHGLLPPPHPSGGSRRDPGLLGKARKPPACSPITSASLPFCSPASRAPPASLPTQRATQGRGCGAHQAARCPPRSDFVEIPPRDRTSGSHLRGTHSDAVSLRLPATCLFLRCSNFERYLRLFAKSPSPNLPSLLPAQLQRAEEPAPSLLRAPVKEACTYLLAFSIGNSFPWQFCRETPPSSPLTCAPVPPNTPKKKGRKRKLREKLPPAPSPPALHASCTKERGPRPLPGSVRLGGLQ